MIEELLKTIFTADQLITEHSVAHQQDCMHLMASCAEELKEIDDKLYQHFQEDITWRTV